MSDPVSKKEKILIIEGSGSLGEKLAEALRAKPSYTVTLVKNGAEAMKAIYDTLPHLIVLDLVIPGGDAYDILDKKQAEPLLAKVPIFLLSTQGLPINMHRVPQNSVTQFIMTLEPSASEIVEKIDLALGHVSAGLTQPVNTAIGAGSGKTIVWVEDDKLIGTILAKKFISSGFNLIHAKNGEEALAQLATVIPNAIILDLILPGMSGFDILQKVRMDERLKKVPAMILSNLSKPSDIEKAKILGAAKFMVKASSSLDVIIAEVAKIAV